MLNFLRDLWLVLVAVLLLALAAAYTLSSAEAQVSDSKSASNRGSELAPLQVPSSPLGDFVLDVVLTFRGTANFSPNRTGTKKGKLSAVALMSQGERWIRAKAYKMRWTPESKQWILDHANNGERVEIIFHAFAQDSNGACIDVTTTEASDWIWSNLPGFVPFVKRTCIATTANESRATITRPSELDLSRYYFAWVWFRDDSLRELGEVPLAIGWQYSNHTNAADDDNVRKFCFGADEGRAWGPHVLGPGNCKDGAPVLLYQQSNFLGTIEGLTGQDHNLADNPVGDNAVFSLRVNPGWQVTLYELFNYDSAGLSETFTRDDNDLGNNAIGRSTSSLQARASGVAVFRDADFAGTVEVFSGCDDDLSDNMIGSNQISAVRVPPGWRLRMWTGTYKSGTKRVYQGIDAAYVGDVLNDQVESLCADSPTFQFNSGEVGDWTIDTID